MQRLLSSVAVTLLWVALAPLTSHADELLKRVQQALRDQGFYYGTIDGAPGDETTQAIRRYQIRNGLQVSGQLTEETRSSVLKAAGGSTGAGESVTVAPSGTVRPRSTPSVAALPAPRPAPTTTNGDPTPPPLARATPGQIAQATPRARPIPRPDSGDEAGGFRRAEPGPAHVPADRPVTADRADPVRRSDNVDQDDGPAPRPAPRPPVAEAAPETRVVPSNAVVPSPRLSALFAGTPYEFAPPPVQNGIVRRVQNKLLRQGFYDQEPDGRLNALTIEALTNFQGVTRLRRTGRLDVETLTALHLTPGELRGPFPNAGNEEDAPRRVPRANGVFEGRVVQ